VEFYLSGPPYIEAKVELVKSPFMDSYPTMFKVYSLEDLLARKMVTLHNRMEGKDMYDLFHALNMEFEINRFLKALKLTIKFYNIEGDFWGDLVSRLSQAKKNTRQIGNSTNHFIPKILRPNWEELVESLRFRIEELKRVVEIRECDSNVTKDKEVKPMNEVNHALQRIFRVPHVRKTGLRRVIWKKQRYMWPGSF